MKKYAFLIIALLLGTFLRLYQLGAVPNGLTWDEAAIGYNAYSLLKTGRDEHGALLPLVFKSFGDYKPGAYIYLTVPSVAVFGLTEFAVRFPSALAGILAIWGIYLFITQLFLTHGWRRELGSFAALALAISPWHIHFSHGAWEVNVFSTVLIFGLYFFLRFLQGRSTLYPALLLACLSLVLYQAAKLLTPLVFLLFISLYWKEFWPRFKPYWSTKKIWLVIPFFLFGAWVFLGSFFGSAGNRLNRLSIFNYRPDLSYENQDIDGKGSLLTPLFHNQPRLSWSLIASRYLYHFSPEVLFFEGNRVSLRAHLPGLGMLNPLEFIWLALGLVWLAKAVSPHTHDTPDRTTLIIIGLLLIAPLPASLTLEEFSTVRDLFMAFPLAMVSGIGLYYLKSKFKFWSLPPLVVYGLLTFYSFDLYFNHSQTAFASEFNYGYKQVVQIIKDNPSSKVIFTDVYGQPYIYYVFYTAYDPATYQQEKNFVSGGLDVGLVSHVGKVEFHQFGSSELGLFKDTLFIGTEGNINNQYDISGPNVSLFKQIETPDHHILFRVIKTKP